MKSLNQPSPNAGTSEPALSGALTVAEVSLPGGAVVGLVPCPGRRHLAGLGRRWQRHLEADLVALEAWGASALVSLVEADEFARLGVAGLDRAMEGRDMRWYHLPVPDMATPGPAFHAAWSRHGGAIMDHLSRGRRLVVHCAGGLGRSGTVAAKLLAAFGVAPPDAIRRVREARPGAIETAEQEAYVLTGPSLS